MNCYDEKCSSMEFARICLDILDVVVWSGYTATNPISEVSIIESKNNQRLLTIIVPAYNVERYIDRCLRSLLNQTCRDFTVIIVDDGSTDGTADICEGYVSEHGELFACIHQCNKGLGAARNVGLTKADTPYVAFLDSDDWQDIRFVEKIACALERLDFAPDMLFTLPGCYDEASHRAEDWMDKPLYEEVFGIREGGRTVSAREHPELYLLEVNANRKVYRRAFLKECGFAFPEGVRWEDIRPHVQLCHLAKNIAAVPDTGFVYRTNHGGQITAGTGAGRLDILSVFEDVLETVGDGSYSREELAAVTELICRYSFWMIEMTNTEYIGPLLEGLHGLFEKLPEEMVSAFSPSGDQEERNKKLGFLHCLRSGDYSALTYYDERRNLYRYWSLHGGRKKNIVSGGIQCIRDSGLKYTLKLLFRKLFTARM